jgi:hypothetical protein
MHSKPVYLDDLETPIGQAVTTYTAALHARDAGVPLNPACSLDRSCHISEGPAGFYVTTEAR